MGKLKKLKSLETLNVFAILAYFIGAVIFGVPFLGNILSEITEEGIYVIREYALICLTFFGITLFIGFLKEGQNEFKKEILKINIGFLICFVFSFLYYSTKALFLKSINVFTIDLNPVIGFVFVLSCFYFSIVLFSLLYSIVKYYIKTYILDSEENKNKFKKYLKKCLKFTVLYLLIIVLSWFILKLFEYLQNIFGG